VSKPLFPLSLAQQNFLTPEDIGDLWRHINLEKQVFSRRAVSKIVRDEGSALKLGTQTPIVSSDRAKGYLLNWTEFQIEEFMGNGSWIESRYSCHFLILLSSESSRKLLLQLEVSV
jgi:hypothetical protein